MKIQEIHVGMRIEHPHHGMGVVKRISEHTVDVDFSGELRTVDPDSGGVEPFHPKAFISGLDVPLSQIIAQTAQAVVRELGLEKAESFVKELGARWNGGKMVLHPADTTLQPKEIPLEAFFHKVVMMRNNLRVLEQKINAHPGLSDGDKVEIQQYISRCYGSMTTFNILFKNKEDQFSSKDA
jgi:hypothetical protein